MKIPKTLVASNPAGQSGLIPVGRSGHPDDVAGESYWKTILAERGKLSPARRCLDLERGTMTEVEAIDGKVVQGAAQAGLEAHFNEIMRRLFHGLVANQEIV